MAVNPTSIASVIQKAVDTKLKELHTMMPGIIVSYDAEKQTAEVQPAIRRVFVVRESNRDIMTPADLPVLINVPVIFPRGSGFSLTFPIVAGDECLINFCERSIDKWHTDSGVQDPKNFRQHSLSDAVCFVGIGSLPNVIADFSTANVELRDEAGTTKISITPDNKILMDAVTEITVTAPLTVWEGDINLTGDLTHTGNVEQTGDLTRTGAATQIGNVIHTGNMARTGNLGNTGAISLVSAGAPIELGGDVESTGSVESVGPMTASEVTAGGVVLSTHVHSGVTTGPSSTDHQSKRNLQWH